MRSVRAAALSTRSVADIRPSRSRTRTATEPSDSGCIRIRTVSPRLAADCNAATTRCTNSIEAFSDDGSGSSCANADEAVVDGGCCGVSECHCGDGSVSDSEEEDDSDCERDVSVLDGDDAKSCVKRWSAVLRDLCVRC